MTENPGAVAESEGARTRGSIARRMLIAAAVWSVVVLLVAGGSLQALYRAEIDRQLDVSINDTMRTLANAVDSDDRGEPKVDPAKLPKDEKFAMALQGRYWAYLIVDEQNKITLAKRSESFADARPQPPDKQMALARARPGVTVHVDAPGPNEQLRIGLQAVQLPARTLPVILYVGVDRTMADQATGRFAWTLVIALGLLAVGLIGGIVVLIRYGLRPLHEIEDKLHDVRAGRLDHLGGEYPRELTPLVKEIDTLISHNRKVVERARTHVGNLAHALKTPLAVLMNESRSGQDKMSELVRRQSEAMSSNISHYLKRAQAAAQAEVLGARSDVKDAVEGIARMLERLHRDKGLTVHVDADERSVFRGERGDLDELVGNLLENAAKWCKSRVRVKVSRLEDGVEVCVDDDGPGLPAENRAKALQRGKRLDESEPGTGLGLSIVTELADIYGGRLYLEDSPMGGLRARLVLPAAPL
jgi:signal transduction histidine kinase